MTMSGIDMLRDPHKTADHLWFSFVHESARLLLHRDQDVLDVDDGSGDLENEADSFAREILITASVYQDLAANGAPTLNFMRTIAEEQGPPTDSLIGMLQHDGYLGHGSYRELKRPAALGLAKAHDA